MKTKMTRKLTQSAILFGVFLSLLAPVARAQKTVWRQATNAKLAALLPARATVVNEHIETEMRTATGIVDNHGRYIAGVVLITAGYSADGKYSHYLVVQAPVRVGGVLLRPGQYVLGWVRAGSALNVHFNVADTGALVGNALARRMAGTGRVESLRIWPPADRSIIQIGRFDLPYKLVKK